MNEPNEYLKLKLVIKQFLEQIENDIEIDPQILRRFDEAIGVPSKLIKITLSTRDKKNITSPIVSDRLAIPRENYTQIESLFLDLITSWDISKIGAPSLTNWLIVLETVEWNTIDQDPLKLKLWNKLSPEQKTNVAFEIIKFCNESVLAEDDSGTKLTIKAWNHLLREVSRSPRSLDPLIGLLDFIIVNYYNNPDTVKSDFLFEMLSPRLKAILLNENFLNSYHSTDIYNLLASKEENLEFVFAYIISDDVLFAEPKAVNVFSTLESVLETNPAFRTNLAFYIYSSFRKIEPRNELLRRTLRTVTEKSAQSISDKLFFEEMSSYLRKPSDFIIVARLMDYCNEFQVNVDATYFHNELVRRFFNCLKESSNSIAGNLSSHYKLDHLLSDLKSYQSQVLCAHLLIGLMNSDDATFNSVHLAIGETLTNIRPMFFGDFEAHTTASKFVNIIMLCLLSFPSVTNVDHDNSLIYSRLISILKSIELIIKREYLKTLAPFATRNQKTNFAFMSDEEFILGLISRSGQPENLMNSISLWFEDFPIDWQL